MRVREVPVGECAAHTRNLTKVDGATPPRWRQSMVFEAGDLVLVEKTERSLAAGDDLIGKPKGLVQVLKECGLWVKGMSMKGPVLKGMEALAREEEEAEDEDLEDEERQQTRDLTLSLTHVLSQMSDFKKEKSSLERAINEMGGEVSWLPKYHAPCNGIEYVWGNGKKRNRKLCDFKMKTLRVTAFRCFQTTEPALVRKYFRKARNYQTVLREGADAFSIHKDVKELKKKRLVWGKAAAESQKPGSKGGAHASHRRPAPSEYNAE
jgi:hypothetical protein|tara:strand:- start:768 stop:1562 length:795 start_codon:yes stop_codon:yes gene_type:complete